MKIFSVSEFIEYVNGVMREAVSPTEMAVEGEVASFGISQQQWVRFDLKDGDGLLNCFLHISRLRQPLEDGMKIRVFGYPKIYAKYGKLSLVVERIELVGEGALRRAFELLKKKLEAEGLFAPERKRPIPRFPEHVGIIASRESAAYSDFLRIAGNRWGGVRFSLAHVQVQGEPAVRQIVGAFRHFNALAGSLKDAPEVLVLIRGGGSMEDLQAFNSEEVARAVFASQVPVVVGVGHERDETLADYVADLRASTPSNAAELVVPARSEVAYSVAAMHNSVERGMIAALSERNQRLQTAAARIETHIAAVVNRGRNALAAIARAGRTLISTAAQAKMRIETLERLIRTLDPRALLRRGYAIARDASGRILRDAEKVSLGAAVRLQLAHGALHTKVVKKD